MEFDLQTSQTKADIGKCAVVVAAAINNDSQIVGLGKIKGAGRVPAVSDVGDMAPVNVAIRVVPGIAAEYFRFRLHSNLRCGKRAQQTHRERQRDRCRYKPFRYIHHKKPFEILRNSSSTVSKVAHSGSMLNLSGARKHDLLCNSSRLYSNKDDIQNYCFPMFTDFITG